MAKALTKQDLKQPDEFITWGTKAAEFAQKNIAIVVIAALIPLVGVGSIFMMSYQKNQREMEAAGKLFAAEQKSQPKAVMGFRLPGMGGQKPEDVRASIGMFDDVAKEYPGTKAERRAHLLAGDAAFSLEDWDTAVREYDAANDGTPLERYYALTGKAHSLEGKKAWDDAISSYKKILDDSAIVNRDLAAIDLARVYETAGKNDDAKTLLAKFDADFPNSAMKATADARLAELGGSPAPAASGAESSPTPGIN